MLGVFIAVHLPSFVFEKVIPVFICSPDPQLGGVRVSNIKVFESKEFKSIPLFVS